MKTSPRQAVSEGIVYEQQVAFHDCDPLGIVWHGNYYKYLENARTELFRSRRLDVQDFIAMKLRLVVIETRCRHAFPMRYGERISIKAWFKDYEQRLHVAYEMRNLDHGRRAGRAWTILVPTTEAGEMLLETPNEIVDRIRRGPVAGG